MLIPLRTDRTPRRQPVVTEALIVLNMLVYLAGLVGQSAGKIDGESIAGWGHFDPRHFQLWQLVTYQFVHDPHGVFHLVFNMLFLWVFGTSVEDRLGRLGFLGFYLVGGCAAGLGHMLVSQAPVIGASGSVAAVTGAFLALFPRSRIRVLLFFFIIGFYMIPSLWFIGFYMLIDVLSQTGALFRRSENNVAYMAHLAGYFYGFAVGFGLLATGILKHEDFDVFYLFKQWRRRAEFRAAGNQQTGGLWEHSSRDTGERLAQRKFPEMSAQDEQHSADRTQINKLVDQHRLAEAAAAYRTLLGQPGAAVLSEGRMLDVANQLSAEADWSRAAETYELWLNHYPSGIRAAEVRLLLGLIYTRHLRRAEQARGLVSDAIARLSDPDQKALGRQLLDELSDTPPASAEKPEPA